MFSKRRQCTSINAPAAVLVALLVALHVFGSAADRLIHPIDQAESFAGDQSASSVALTTLRAPQLPLVLRLAHTPSVTRLISKPTVEQPAIPGSAATVGNALRAALDLAHHLHALKFGYYGIVATTIPPPLG